MIADKIDHKGFCYPSIPFLAKIGGLGIRTVIRSVNSLAERGLIIITKDSGKRNQYTIVEKVLDERIECVKKGKATSATVSLVPVPQSHPTSATQSPDPCHTVTLVNKVVDKEVNNGSKVISKNKITKTNSGSKEGVGEEMKIEDLDLAVFKKTDKKKMNPIDIWRNACVDFQNEHLLAIVNLKFTQVDAGVMNKVAKKLEGGFKESLEHAVWNWEAFVKYVNLQTGGAKKPLAPKMNFFVYHSNLALLFFQKKSDTKIKLKTPQFKKKPITDAHTKALLKAVGKISGD